MARCEDCIHYGVCAELERYRDPLWFTNTKDEFCCSSYLPADVAPRAEVAMEILDEIEKTLRWTLTLVGLSYKHNFKEIQCRKECYEDFLGYIAELKKKYTEGDK